jgi:hypothetical protein
MDNVQKHNIFNKNCTKLTTLNKKNCVIISYIPYRRVVSHLRISLVFLFSFVLKQNGVPCQNIFVFDAVSEGVACYVLAQFG